MLDFSIGVVLDSFCTDPGSAMKKASELGLDGFQIYALPGHAVSSAMTAAERREFRSMADSYGLKISALCGDLGKGFYDPLYNESAIEESKGILELAKELGTDVVTTHIGVVPSDPQHPRYRIMQEACGRLAEFSDSLEAHFAIETGPEPPEVLRDFLNSLHSTGVAVNLDPANLAMTFEGNAADAVYTLRDYIVHTHAKDGIRLKPCDPEILYGLRPTEDGLPLDEDQYSAEVVLGTGSVCWPQYLQALHDIGYHGFLTIEREVGSNPASDIRLAADFLRQYVRQPRKTKKEAAV